MKNNGQSALHIKVSARLPARAGACAREVRRFPGGMVPRGFGRRGGQVGSTSRTPSAARQGASCMTCEPRRGRDDRGTAANPPRGRRTCRMVAIGVLAASLAGCNAGNVREVTGTGLGAVAGGVRSDRIDTSGGSDGGRLEIPSIWRNSQRRECGRPSPATRPAA